MKLNMMKNTFGLIDIKLGFQPVFFMLRSGPQGVASGLK